MQTKLNPVYTHKKGLGVKLHNGLCSALFLRSKKLLPIDPHPPPSPSARALSGAPAFFFSRKRAGSSHRKRRKTYLLRYVVLSTAETMSSFDGNAIRSRFRAYGMGTSAPVTCNRCCRLGVAHEEGGVGVESEERALGESVPTEYIPQGCGNDRRATSDNTAVCMCRASNAPWRG